MLPKSCPRTRIEIQSAPPMSQSARIRPKRSRSRKSRSSRSRHRPSVGCANSARQSAIRSGKTDGAMWTREHSETELCPFCLAARPRSMCSPSSAKIEKRGPAPLFYITPQITLRVFARSTATTRAGSAQRTQPCCQQNASRRKRNSWRGQTGHPDGEPVPVFRA